MSGTAALPRIVTMHDFEIVATENTDKKTDIPQVTYKAQAKTYRYVGSADTQTAANTAGGAQ